MAKNDGQGPATPPPGLAMLIGQLGKMGGGVGGGIGNIGGLFPGAGGPGIIGGSPNPPNMGGPRTNMPTPGFGGGFFPGMPLGLSPGSMPPQGPVTSQPSGTIGGMPPTTPQIPQNPMAPDMGRVTPNPGAGFTGMKRKREY